MNRTLFVLLVYLATLGMGHAQAPMAQKPNILLICVDDLRPELRSFGVDYIHSPHIDRLAQKGMAFRRHYVNAPSCGPSRATLLTGTYGASGNYALFKRAEKIAQGEKMSPTLPEWFRNQGYRTVSVGKVSHHPGGRGGTDWNDSTVVELPGAWDKHLMPVGDWQHPRGMMHGLAHGEIRIKQGEMDVIQHSAGDDSIYPDGLMMQTALTELDSLAQAEQPFFLAVGIIKPHLPFGAPKKYYDLYQDVALPPIAQPEKPEGRTTWHKSGEFMKYNRWGKDPNTDPAFATEVRKHYAASVSYADAQVGKILEALKEKDLDQNTVVVLWGDHGWHLGEQGIWGKHSLFERSLHAPLIVYDPRQHLRGQTQAIVETVDIFPTLCDLSGLPQPEFSDGVSLRPIMENPQEKGRPALGYQHGRKTLRSATHRFILHADGFVELYDHTNPEKESKNIAEAHPELVAEFKAELEKRLK
ncbi:sulfatase [Sediminicola luteus]|uniref:Iduronate-2-sulfatase n=1 Tax=Sediminicola luteus TaxID=319238 RepID=A0A2A4G585_9FLAO|nr:sulfatase [Sediminicola luteus]PCE62902.1 iduronate-2-sulfatase [Sediminicola luteus]